MTIASVILPWISEKRGLSFVAGVVFETYLHVESIKKRILIRNLIRIVKLNGIERFCAERELRDRHNVILDAGSSKNESIFIAIHDG